MAQSDRREVLVITNGNGLSRQANVKAWKDWADGLEVHISGQLDHLLLDVLTRNNYTHAWIADANYAPYPSAFRMEMRRKLPDETKWSVFTTAKPLAARSFYEQKFTTDNDPHDTFGGLRYVELSGFSGVYDYDKDYCGREVDFIPYKASRLGFPYSVFQLSSGEPYEVCGANLETIQPIYPHVYWHASKKTILGSHADLARMSDTEMFVVLDADCKLLTELVTEEFKPWETDAVHLWYARNPVNGLEYGHGGPKVFNKSAFLKLDGTTLDVTTSASSRQLILHETVVAVHAFNWSPLATYRTAFREAAKLALSLNTLDDDQEWKEASDRLNIWCASHGEGPEYADLSQVGAIHGREWARHVNSREEVVAINNFDWLENQFKLYTGQT